MDFAAAVSHHLQWKQRLRRILLGRERRRSLERTEAIDCQACALAQWLRREAHRFQDEPIFREIEENHRLSHELAIRLVLAEDPDKNAMDVIFRIGQFHMCSRSLLEDLERLRRKFNLDPAPLCLVPSEYSREEFPPTPSVQA